MPSFNLTKTTNFTGRNGYFSCTGIDFLKLEHMGTIMISPITSKGKIGNCNIEVPINDIDEFCKKLKESVK